MELFTNGDFWTIVAIVVSALGVHRAAKADRRRERQEMEKRREAGEKRLAEQISAQGQELSETRRALTEALAAQRRELTEAISTQGRELTEAISAQGREMMDAIGAPKQEPSAAMASQKQEIRCRIDRLEVRFDKNHREVTAALAELKASVSALSVKLDERSRSRGLEGAELPSAGADVAAAVVRETPAPYSADEPKGEAEGVPESSRRHPPEVG